MESQIKTEYMNARKTLFNTICSRGTEQRIQRTDKGPCDAHSNIGCRFVRRSFRKMRCLWILGPLVGH